MTCAAFSLGWASIDRIDSDGSYDASNIRLMHVGLNGLKSACIDDRYIVQ